METVITEIFKTSVLAGVLFFCLTKVWASKQRLNGIVIDLQERTVKSNTELSAAIREFHQASVAGNNQLQTEISDIKNDIRSLNQRLNVDQAQAASRARREARNGKAQHQSQHAS